MTLASLARALVARPEPGADAPLPILWSKGIARHCDMAGPDDYWRAPTESSRSDDFFRLHYADPHGVVWLRLGSIARDGAACDLDRFAAVVLPTARRPFALVTTDGDASVPSDLRPATVAALLDCPWLVAWYTQNRDRPAHPKLRPFPIGLDLHTRPRFTSTARLAWRLARLRDDRPPDDRQGTAPLRIFCDLGVSRSSQERRDLVKVLKGTPHIDFQHERLSQSQIWRRYAAYPFALSTAGHGLDCHRTWELLYLGTIVITRTSPLDPLYDGLPVAIVEDWAEVRDAARLADWHRCLAPLTARAALWERLSPGWQLAPVRAALDTAGDRKVAACSGC